MLNGKFEIDLLKLIDKRIRSGLTVRRKKTYFKKKSNFASFCTQCNVAFPNI